MDALKDDIEDAWMRIIKIYMEKEAKHIDTLIDQLKNRNKESRAPS